MAAEVLAAAGVSLEAARRVLRVRGGPGGAPLGWSRGTAALSLSAAAALREASLMSGAALGDSPTLNEGTTLGLWSAAARKRRCLLTLQLPAVGQPVLVTLRAIFS